MEMTFHLLHAAYVLVLLWYLVRTGPSPQTLPEVDPLVFPRWRSGAWVPAFGVATVFALVVISDDGTDLLFLLMILASIWVLVARWREISFSWVIQGVVLGLIAFLAGIPARNNGLLSDTTFYLLPGLVPLMYVAGGLLSGRTRLGGIQLRAEGPGKAFKSFLWGCLLFLPLGLFNVADGPIASDLTWVSEWWMPLSLPWFSGIAEEAWFRLFLMGLCFYLLRPAFRTRPALAVVATVLICGIIFGLIHGRTLERFLTTGLLYGVPMATVFARRDWEHAVGAHYMVNMPSWVVAFLGS